MNAGGSEVTSRSTAERSRTSSTDEKHCPGSLG
jgi:hypothetical protein